MKDMFGLGFDATVFGIGSLAAAYMLVQLNTYVRRAGTMPRRAARLWKWRIVLGLCGSAVALCFGANDLWLHHVTFAWLLVPEIGVGGAFAVVLFIKNNPDWDTRSQRRELDDAPPR